MLLIVLPQPIHAVIVLRVAHDGVDVIGFLNGEFDDQPRSMHPIIEGTANVAGGTAPGKMQLLEAGASNGVEVPLAASVSALRTYSSTNASSSCFCDVSRSPAGRPSNRLRLLRRPTPVSTSEKNGSVDTTATLACSGWSEPTRLRPRSPS